MLFCLRVGLYCLLMNINITSLNFTTSSKDYVYSLLFAKVIFYLVTLLQY